MEKDNKNIESKKNDEKVVVKEEKKAKNKDEKQITIKFNKSGENLENIISRLIARDIEEAA